MAVRPEDSLTHAMIPNQMSIHHRHGWGWGELYIRPDAIFNEYLLTPTSYPTGIPNTEKYIHNHRSGRGQKKGERKAPTRPDGAIVVVVDITASIGLFRCRGRCIVAGAQDCSDWAFWGGQVGL